MARIKPKQLLIQSKTKKAPSRVSYYTIITWNLIVILVVLSLYATYSHWHQRLMSFPETFIGFNLLFFLHLAHLYIAISWDEVSSCRSFCSCWISSAIYISAQHSSIDEFNLRSTQDFEMELHEAEVSYTILQKSSARNCACIVYN